jgi:Cys-tRNA(Pro) deacylase
VSSKPPVTPAIRALRAAGIEFAAHLFDYDRYPGAVGAADFLEVDPHLVIKTMVMRTSNGDGLLILMHGDREVSTKEAARQLGVKSVEPAGERDAGRWTGYRFGGTSPFGLRQTLAIYAERTIAGLDVVYVNAGRQGFLVEIRAEDLITVSGAELMNVAVE